MSDDKAFDLLGIKGLSDSVKATTQGLLDGAAAFLSRVCLPAAEEFGLALRDRISAWRAKNAAQMLSGLGAYQPDWVITSAPKSKRRTGQLLASAASQWVLGYDFSVSSGDPQQGTTSASPDRNADRPLEEHHRPQAQSPQLLQADHGGQTRPESPEHNDRTRTACVRTHLLTLQLGKGRIPSPSRSVQQRYRRTGFTPSS